MSSSNTGKLSLCIDTIFFIVCAGLLGGFLIYLMNKIETSTPSSPPPPQCPMLSHPIPSDNSDVIV